MLRFMPGMIEAIRQANWPAAEQALQGHPIFKSGFRFWIHSFAAHPAYRLVGRKSRWTWIHMFHPSFPNPGEWEIILHYRGLAHRRNGVFT